MSLKLIKRGKIWHIYGTIHGKTIRSTTGTDKKEIAQAILAQHQSRIINDAVFGEKASATFAEAVSSYLISGGTSRFLGRSEDGVHSGLIGKLFDQKMRTITQNDLDNAARELYPDALPETRNRQCYTPFIAVWNHAVKNDWADPKQWSRPRKAKGTGTRRTVMRSGSTPVTYDRAAEFVSMMSPAPAMVMTALFYTGMRPIELFSLTDKNIDIKGRWIIVESSKTGEPRGVPMHDFLVPIFDALTKQDGIVFRTHKNDPYPILEEGGGQLKSAIDGARKRSKDKDNEIRDVSPYTARHTVSTQLVVNGVHPHVKDQILGHAVDDMSRNYTKIPQQPLIDAINTLPVPEAWKNMWWISDPMGNIGKLASKNNKRVLY